MKQLMTGALAAAALLAPLGAGAADDADIAELKTMIQQMKTDYERKIEALESRLEEAERTAGEAAGKADRASREVAAKPVPSARRGGSRGAVTSGNAFNPQISVILDGNYYTDDVDGEGTELLGEAFRAGAGHGHEDEGGGENEHAHGGAEKGFNFREAEVWLSATVDPYFDAQATLTFDDGGGGEIEEAFLETRSLPGGLKVKAGKFFSDFGYMNRQHPHEWDFVDQNLAHQNLFGFNLADTGVQLTWLPELPVYTLFGVEAFQGEQERFGAFVEDEDERDELALDDEDDGPRLFIGFVKVAPDLGFNHALQLGASVAHATQSQLIGEIEEEEAGFDGDETLWGLDLVYKYDSPRSYGAGDFVLQGEYLFDTKDMKITAFEDDPTLVGGTRKFKTDGWYLQGWYGFAPRWQAGLRYDALGSTNKVTGTGGGENFDESDRWTAALTYRPSEFSMLRLQAATADIVTGEDGTSEDFDYVYLQYILSLGSHGAHKF
ncbi:MAG: TonB-dependent receptor [Gammaproteobacteria bacterium]|nr:TonB-dependent receptor [Gammaproteobacteria bacterium]